jgi:hypothetical protein
MLAMTDVLSFLLLTRIESDSPPKQPKCEGGSSFLKKKNQKTFVLFSKHRSYQARQPMEQKFFGSFFQKRTAFLLRRCVSLYAVNDSFAVAHRRP